MTYRCAAVVCAFFTIALFAACGEDAPPILDARIDAPTDIGNNTGDRDGDGVLDEADNCPDNANAGQENNDNDSQGDLCDLDDDNDTVNDTADNCALTANTDQTNSDTDANGDACDLDDDNDTVMDTADNCPIDANGGQENHDTDANGDACDDDDDADGLPDVGDNCTIDPNPGQENNDGDGIGDLCDPDDDNDTVDDLTDNCAVDANAGQENSDTDPNGDACDDDDDNDGLLDIADNCPTEDNVMQEDTDGVGGLSATAGTLSLRPAPTTIAVAGDDVISGPIPIGFPFEFFGDTLTEIHVSTNGFITFGDASTDGCCSGGALPNPSSPNGVVAMYWEDLNTGPGGTITQGIVGTPPNRELVISWNGVHHHPGGNPVTGQIILKETTNTIEVHCATCPSDGGVHTQGIEDLTGANAAFVPGRIATSFSLSNDAVVFQIGSGLGDGAGDACDVCPDDLDPLQQDGDGDGVGDLCDLCPADVDPLQLETDDDGIGDACDNCPADYNDGQDDGDNDGLGDVCDDSDNDGVVDADDNCPLIGNPGQEDSDFGGEVGGPPVDFDLFGLPAFGKIGVALGGGGGDGIGDACDNCPLVYNPSQDDGDNDGLGDACEDGDGDGVLDIDDNCPAVSNPGQEDDDDDGVGNACDNDADNDGVINQSDNCPDDPNPGQGDVDMDGVGDACDDSDGDGLLDADDNCPAIANPGQEDTDGVEGDGDGAGNACDNCPFIGNPTQADADNDGIGDACETGTCATPVIDGCVAAEVCGNGTDDNCNGLADENCACTPGAVQACFRGPPGRRHVGACIDGTQTCNTAGTGWGACTSGISPGAEACDGLDNDCNGCEDEGCGVVQLACPGPGELPEGSPFVDYVVNGAQFFSGAVQSWNWTVQGGPCDRLFLTTTSPLRQTFSLTGQTTSQLTLRPSLSGDYNVRMNITAVGGQQHTCSFVVHVANPGLRVEMCSDRSGSTDIDTHLHRPGTTTNWFTGTDDCYYANCAASSGSPPSWGYPNSPLAECSGGPQGSTWTSLGYCRNPRLDIDSIAANGVPENINVDVPGNGETFRVMTHYYSGSGVVHPMVNIYCGGILRGSYGAPGNVLTNFDTSGSGSGDIWRVVDATMQVSGMVTTGCTLTPLHPPAQTTGYWVTNDRTY